MPAPIRYIRLDEVMHRSGLARATVYQKMSQRTFPVAHKLGAGARSVGWRSDQLDAWLNDPAGYQAPAPKVSESFS